MLELLTAIPMLWRLIAVGVVVVAIGGAFAGWSIHEYNLGSRDTINAIAAKDQAALERVQVGAATIAACRASGKTWDVVTGTCQ